MTAGEIIYYQPHLINKILYEFGGLTTHSCIAFKEGTQIKEDDYKIEIMCMIKEPKTPDGDGGLKWGEYKSYGYEIPKRYAQHLNTLISQYQQMWRDDKRMKTLNWECDGDYAWEDFYTYKTIFNEDYDSDYIDHEPSSDDDDDDNLILE